MPTFDAQLVNVGIGAAIGIIVMASDRILGRKSKQQDELKGTLKGIDEKLDNVVIEQKVLSNRVGYLEKPRRRWYG